MVTAPASSGVTERAALPPISDRALAVRSSAIRDLLALTTDGSVRSLAGGLPALDLVDDPAFARIASELLEGGPAALQYATTEGEAALRSWIAAERLGGVDAEAVLVTHGSQQALELVVRALIDPGGVVVTEDPTYLGAVQVLATSGAKPVAIPVDREGMQTDLL
ncbi:MAG TPA: aminotransferase class I/II-fold pyridoxal phosphate-dependent enzyme, partial [Acidimicrobiales bacterium]